MLVGWKDGETIASYQDPFAHVQRDLHVSMGAPVRPTRTPPPQRVLSIAQLGWEQVPDTSGYGIWSGKLRTPSGEIALGRGHRALFRHIARVDVSAGIALAVSGEWFDCHVEDRFVLEVVDLSARTVLWRLESAGRPQIQFGESGAFYLQFGGRTYRYADPRSEAREELPAGFGMTSGPNQNPGC